MIPSHVAFAVEETNIISTSCYVSQMPPLRTNYLRISPIAFTSIAPDEDTCAMISQNISILIHELPSPCVPATGLALI